MSAVQYIAPLCASEITLLIMSFVSNNDTAGELASCS